MKNVFFRKLNAHELGYRGDKPGGAGRYLLITKNNEGFFPPLSETRLNDSLFLKLIPPFATDDIVLSRFVYHNDRHISSSGTRDEMRLYLNKDVDPEGTYYSPNDIVLFQKFDFGEGDIIYRMYIFKRENIIYSRLDKLGEKYKINPRGTHSLIPLTELGFLSLDTKLEFEDVLVPEEVQNAALEEPEEEMVEKEETRLIRSTNFRDLVLFFYDYKCVVSGEKFLIRYGAVNNLEAAHIHARSAKGPDHTRNGIPLTRNYHWAFDNGFFTLTKEFHVEVHPDAKQIEPLQIIDNKEIILPMDTRAYPDLKFVDWHRKNVYGVFQRKV